MQIPQFKLYALIALSISLPGIIPSPLYPQSFSLAQAQTTVQNKAPLRVIILPFKNITRKQEDEWLRESFSESLTMALTQVQALELIERSQIQTVLQEQSFTQSAFVDEASAPQLGKLLGAEKILLGNFQNINQTLVVNTRLVDVQTGKIEPQLTAQVQGPFTQLLNLQNQLSEQLLQNLQLNPSALENQNRKAVVLSTALPGAYEKYQKAQALIRQGSDTALQQAIDMLESAIANDPNYALAHAALSEALSTRSTEQNAYPSAMSNDLERAVAAAQKALNLNANLGVVYHALANAYFAQGNRNKALETIEQALTRRPGDTDHILAYLRYKYHQTLPDISAVEADLQRLQANRQDPWIQLELATLYLDKLKYQPQPQTAPVSKLLSAAQQGLPRHPMVPLRQAELKVLQQDYTAATTLVNQALALEPNNFLLYHLGAVTLLYGPNVEHVRQLLRKSIELNPQFGYSSITLGYTHMRLGEHQQAQSYFEEATRILPDSAALEFVKGKFNLSRQNYSQARKHFLQALQRWGESPVERTERGAILLRLGDIALAEANFNQAQDYYQQALKEERPFQAQARLSLAKVYQQQQNYAASLKEFEAYFALVSPHSQAEARPIYQRVYLLEQLSREPRNVKILNDLGSLAMQSQEWSEAEDYFQRALQQNAQNLTVRYNLGLLRLQQKQWAQAITAFQAILSQNAAHSNARYHLGLAQLNSGDKAAAKATWEALLKQNPNHSQAQSALNQL